MPDEFHGDKTLLTSYKISSFYLLTMSTKVIIFNIMKLSMKSPLSLALVDLLSWGGLPFDCYKH